MLRLHDLLGEHEGPLLEGWSTAARNADPSARLDEKAREGVASFLRELKSALRRATAEGMPPTGAPENQANGTEDSGADLDPAVATRAYGSLHGLILETAAKLGIEVSLAEQKTLVLQVNETVARALAGYVRNQERELHRVAHELRNPLGSAMMALTLLRSRVDLGDHIRLAEMLERNLHRLEQGLDDALARRQRDEGGKAALDR